MERANGKNNNKNETKDLTFFDSEESQDEIFPEFDSQVVTYTLEIFNSRWTKSHYHSQR